MSLTLLLDLDDTLLCNDIESFLPQYLGAFSEEVSPYIGRDVFIQALLGGTRAMQNNRMPDCTLQEVFEAYFFSNVEVDEGEFRRVSNRFYNNVFPTLKELTQPNQGAVELVKEARMRGYKLAVATNPLFPRTAILQRLEWAKLPKEENNFEVIASYEDFHFAKPDPAFLAEVLAHMGWPDGPVVMVGDDSKRDIAAARQIGIPAFWITQDGGSSQAGSNEPTANGKIEDLIPWLDRVSAQDLQPDYASPSAMLAVLRATPAALDGIFRGLPTGLWSAQPQEGEWCATEVLCHLRDVELEVNLPRIRKVLDQRNPFLPGEDTDPWAKEREYIRQDGRAALHQFMAARVRLLNMLEAGSMDIWGLTARHAIFGPTDLAELVSIIAGHDRLHLQQIHSLLEEISVTP